MKWRTTDPRDSIGKRAVIAVCADGENPRLRNGKSRLALAVKVFTPPGKLYPRVSIAVYPGSSIYGYEGVVFSCYRKRWSGCPWEECPIPMALLKDAAELLLASGGER